MSIWFFLQIVVDVFFVVGFVVFWVRLKRPPQDDPRLSRGLQLLQSKISVLEDLSDRTEVQVKQLNHLLEKKAHMVQQRIEEAERQMKNIDQSMNKSLEVAEIFQDKIPHEEILERQHTVKYVKAAQMAHEGFPIEEIMDEVDLPRGEVEFIAKVNKDKLMFDEENLPRWVKVAKEKKENPQSLTEDLEAALDFELNSTNMLEDKEFDFDSAKAIESQNIEGAFNIRNEDYSSLKSLGDEFRKACEEYEGKQAKIDEENQAIIEKAQKVINTAKSVTTKIVDGTEEALHSAGHVALEMGKKLMHEGDQLIKSKKAPQVKLIEKGIPAKKQTASMTAQKINEEPKKRVISTKSKQRPVIQKVEFPRIDVNDNLG